KRDRPGSTPSMSRQTRRYLPLLEKPAKSLQNGRHDFQTAPHSPDQRGRAAMPYVDARPSAPERPHQASSLVGRDRELNRLTRLLRQPDTRLVTLTGPGGVGKTRLALTLSGTIASEFAQGMIFLDLASLGNPAALPQRLAQALSLPIIGGRAPMEAISTYLHDKHLLLLFDNFEH